MQPGVLLPDPVWNLALVRWMDLRTIPVREMSVEERERQPMTTRPKTMNGWFLPVCPGRTLPSPDLNPAHDDRTPDSESQVESYENRRKLEG